MLVPVSNVFVVATPDASVSNSFAPRIGLVYGINHEGATRTIRHEFDGEKMHVTYVHPMGPERFNLPDLRLGGELLHTSFSSALNHLKDVHRHAIIAAGGTPVHVEPQNGFDPIEYDAAQRAPRHHPDEAFRRI